MYEKAHKLYMDIKKIMESGNFKHHIAEFEKAVEKLITEYDTALNTQ